MGVRTMQRSDLGCTANAEETDPAEHIRIDLGDAIAQRLAPVSRRQLDDLVGEAALRPLRQQDFDVSIQRLTPQAEPDEVSILRSRHGALFSIHIAPSATF